MQASKFEDRVRQHAADLKSRAAGRSVDWDERTLWWQQRVARLLDQIQDWLAPLLRSQTVTFIRSTVSRTEEHLGTYAIESGLIRLGQDDLRMLPVGSIIVGGYGRIDVDGPNGSVAFILSAPDPTLPADQRRDSAIWFVAHPRQRRELYALDREAFERLFADLFGIDR